MLNAKTIGEAQERIAKIIVETPVLPSFFLQKELGCRVLLKLENLNLSGSFKIRGAANALLSRAPAELKKGVIAASAGNHAQGVAHVCRILGAKSTIFMPQHTPLIKVESTRTLGAEIKLVGRIFDDAYQAAVKYQAEAGGIMVHPYADFAVMNGQGTIGLELLRQVDDIGMVVVPVGGGGLINGIACALKEKNPAIKIIGVQTKAFPAMKLSFDAGKKVLCDTQATIADGIAVKGVNEANLELVMKYVDEFVLVGEEEIASAVMILMERNHLLAEGAGAVAVAALLKLGADGLKAMSAKSVVAIISGGNIDVNLLGRITRRGLIHSGRLMRLRFNIMDRPGCLVELLEVLSAARVNIIDIHHQRIFSSAHYNEVEVDAEVETIDVTHQEKALHTLDEAKIKYTVLS